MSAVVTAHDADIAAIKITRQPSDNWQFELHTPLHGLDEAMRLSNKARTSDIDDLNHNSTRYKELIVDYVKSRFDVEPGPGALDDDGQSTLATPELGQGRIKLGEHASVLIFDIKNMPEMVGDLSLHLPYMQNNPHQQTVLWLIDGERKQSYALRADNNFTVKGTDFFTGNTIDE